MVLSQKLFCIATAGALGTLSRYGLAGLVQRLAGSGFPWGTAAVNVIGCFLFGLVWTLGAERMALSAEARTILLTGFMGAFTTFSTFISETGQLAGGAQWWVALGNITLQVGAGLAIFFAGASLARLL